MNEEIPYLPFSLWLLASACLILLLLVVFGYHLYQRSRIRALTQDSASLGKLAAKKEALEADVESLRQWLLDQKAERLKLEAERHGQELVRAEIAQLDRQLEDRKKAGDLMAQRTTELEVMLARRKTALAHMETEIASLEQQRQELGPLEKYVQELRLEIDNGKLRLGQMAEQEVRTASLQHRAQQLEDELEELKQTLEPMRHEKQKLRQFIEQARHATTLKNEQLLEQKQALRALQRTFDELEMRKRDLGPEVERLQGKHDAKARELAEMQEKFDLTKQEREEEHSRRLDEMNAEAVRLREEMEAEASRLRERLDAEAARLQERIDVLAENLAREEATVQRQREANAARMKADLDVAKSELDAVLARRAEAQADFLALCARKTALEAELQEMRPKLAKRSRAKKSVRLMAPRSGQRRIGRKPPARPAQIFCSATEASAPYTARL